MKTIFKASKMTTFVFLCTLLSCLSSCNKEDLFVEDIIEVVEEDTALPEDTNDDIVEVDPTVPCDFTLDGVQPNATIVINCVLDLGGQTFALPENVTLVYEGGDIINGKINFSDNSVISGELLDESLTLGGSTPQVKDPTFHFDPARWGIVEGIVSDAVASKNKDILKSLLFQVSDLGINTFKIDKLDAYFKVDLEPGIRSTPTLFTINIPSNFSLLMTDNTHLRIQPNAYKQPTLLSILDAENVLIQGGILHGERDEHDYSDGGTHEWETIISIKSGRHIRIENVVMMDAAGDGMGISGLGHAFAANYKPSYDVIITGNKFIRNRRNNLSITDGHDLIIENNEFIDAGIHTEKSQGTAPGFAIDVEAVRHGDGTIYQISEDIIIRNNIETGSRVGGFTVHTGDRITIENNTMEKVISYSTSIGTIIRNNTMVAVDEITKTNGVAISAGRNDRYERNYGNRVYGNTITGFSTGIQLANTDLEVFDNTITNCKRGISIQDLSNSKIYNNKLQSSIDSSDGIVTSGASIYLNEVIINNNTIDVQRGPMKFTGLNTFSEHANYSFTVKDNTCITGGTTISSVHGFKLIGNNFKHRIRLINSVRGEISNNNIIANYHGVRIDSGCEDIIISSNDINVPDNYECVWSNNSDQVNIDVLDNVCN